MSSEDIITLQKSLFSHNVSCDSDFFSVPKEWRPFKQWKCLEVISLNNGDSFFYSIFLHLKSLKEQLVFHDLNYILKHKQDTLFLFSIQKNKSIFDIIFL